MMKKLILILSCLFLSIGLIYSQNITVNGVVVDDAGIEVIGASVVVKGTTTGVATDIDGKFSLNVPSNSTLVFSLVGMKKVEMKATPSMKVVMENDDALLEEVIVTGYGNVKKSSFTGAAATLSTKGLEDVPTTSITSKIAGAAAGVQIGAATGAPGALESMRIRGTGSINASNEPLYVLDGVPMVNENAANFDYSDSGTSMLASINSSDIESITIIKDAAAASLYGSRAANGVVVITTKQGSQGKTKINLKSSWGFSNMAVNYRPTLGGDERRELLYHGLENYAVDNSISDPKAYADKEIEKYAEKPWSGWEDWRDTALRTGNQESYDLSIQGGNAKTNFFSSLSYVSSNGITLQSKYQRVTGRLNVNHQATDKLKLSMSTLYANSKQDVVNEGSSYSNPIYGITRLLSPQDYAYNEDGTLNTTNKFLGMASNGGLANPLNVLANDYDKNKINRFLGSISAQYDIYAGVYAKQVLSMDYTDVKSAAWWSPFGPNGKPPYNGVMQKFDVEYKNLVSQSQIGYIKSFNKIHNFDALFSYEVTKYDRAELYLSGIDFPNPLKNDIENAADTSSSSHLDQKRMISYLLLANYNYDNRYYVSANYRRDGSSQFARDSRWGNFWSVSGSWRLTEEKFMEETKEILNDAKLRVSYGLNGNLPLGYYDFMDVYKYGNRYNGVNGSAEARIAYTDLTWEKNYNLNIGLDLHFLNRFNLSLEYYNRDTEDLLLAKSISQTAGFGSSTMNLGAMNNKGIEVTLESMNIQNGDFFWKTSINLAHNKNKLTKLDGIADEMTMNSSILRHKIGKDFNTFYAYEYAGVDHSTGKESYYKNTGANPRETTTDVSEAEKVLLDKVSPTVQGGITNTFSYKGFDLGFTFTYSLGGHMMDLGAINGQGASGGAALYVGAVPDYFNLNDVWKTEGDAKLPRFVYGNKTEISSRFIHSTNHLRLKNITLGYKLPSSILRPIQLDQVRLFASAVNLFTIKSSELPVDPELPVNQTYGARTYGGVSYQIPALRTVTFGVEVTF